MRPLIDDDHLHAACAGQLAGLLYLAEQLGEDEAVSYTHLTLPTSDLV